ncbi:hypothetical protein [Streptomyces sp. NBC_01614]|uniref:hypothetical protein n=1 Tax=Streptomyces sp. NBC_01614 TaxID=2975897 RepID=UPI003867F5A4
MEMIKPVRQSSPPKIIVDNQEWIRAETENKTWSFYKAENKPFHISVENKSGKAHASPDGIDNVLSGKTLHVYEAGPVVNYVATGLQEQVGEWLADEDEMRKICRLFREEWPDAMEKMHATHQTELQQYNEWLTEQKNNWPKTKEEEAAEALKESERRRSLARILKNTSEVGQVERVTPTAWMVRYGEHLYALPASAINTAMIKGKWTEKAFSMAAHGDFIVIKRHTVPFIVAKRRLKKELIVDEILQRILELPEAELSYGMLRTPGQNYRVTPMQKKILISISREISRNFDPAQTSAVFRVEIRNKTYVVQPTHPKLGLQTEAQWNDWIKSLPEAELKGEVVTLPSGQQYIWKGVWPDEPTEKGPGYHRILASDGVFIAQIDKPDFFIKVHPKKGLAHTWMDTLPKAVGRLLPHGTLTLNVGEGKEMYVVARGYHEKLLQLSQRTLPGTPGCFKFDPSNIGASLPPVAIDPAAHPDLLRTKTRWEEILKSIPSVKIMDNTTISINLGSEGCEMLFELPKKLPEHDLTQNLSECYTMKKGGETLIVAPRTQKEFAVSAILTSPKAKKWIESLPRAAYSSRTATVRFGSETISYTMTEDTWLKIARQSEAEVIAVGTPGCFVVTVKGAMKGLAVNRRNPLLVSSAAWNAWVTGLPRAEMINSISGDLCIYAVGHGPATQVFEVDMSLYKEPPCGSVDCFVVGSKDNPRPVSKRSAFARELDPASRELTSLPAIRKRMSMFSEGSHAYVREQRELNRQGLTLPADGTGDSLFSEETHAYVREQRELNQQNLTLPADGNSLSMTHVSLHNDALLQDAPFNGVDDGGSPSGNPLWAYFTGTMLVMYGDTSFHNSADLYSRFQNSNGQWVQVFLYKVTDENQAGYRLMVGDLPAEHEQTFRDYMTDHMTNYAPDVRIDFM